MFLRSIVPFLLLVASQAAIAAPLSSANSQPSVHGQLSSQGIDTESPFSSAQSRQAKYNPELNERLPTLGQQGIALHGKDDREKELSLCEAGIVPACRSSIEAAQAESQLLAATEKIYEETSTLPDDNDFNRARLFPSAEFLMISCAIVCVITIARRCIPQVPSDRSNSKLQHA
ncbi:hypothetical protein N7448_010414 [Penicillium atrosanguineum]|nr:hypothetical protein N7448_010414 [Penicillium atrosanguineum]